jgi:D-beta-D-heptose 7-phosphate kinase/D-beta-D-heptose 1-phosphate adenosyltransferase
VEKADLLAGLAQCQSRSIVVIGDLMLDEYHWCKVNRLSPEAPVPICSVESTTLVPGGAANVANNLNQLGCAVSVMGMVGKDSSGDKLIASLQQNKVNTDFIIRSSSKPTILKSRIIAHHQHVVRVDREDTSPIANAIQKKMMTQLKTVIKTTHAILISDYLKGTLPDRFLQGIIELANDHSIPVVIDPKGTSYKKYRGATVLTPNYGEFKSAIGKTPKNEDEIQKEGQKLKDKLKLKALLVTRSEKGMSLIHKAHKWDIPTKAQEVYDITGAGDTVIATLTMAVASGLSWEMSASLANYAAGIVVGKLGTSTVTMDEISRSIQDE